MNRKRADLAVVLALLTALIPLGCGGNPTQAPTAPATVVDQPSASSGPVAGSPASGAVFNLEEITVEGTAGAGVAAPVVGIVARVSGTCPALTFVLSGVTVQISSRTTIEGGTCADIKEGMRAGAIGDRNADGSVQAVRMKVGPPPPAPATGLVAKLAGSCPNLTFELEGVAVHTSGKTVFDGGKCGDLANGMRAGAIGPKGADGAIEAEHVKMAAPPPPPVPAPTTGASVTGVVKAATGTCPSLTITIEATTVYTSGRTLFDAGACGDVKVGVRAGAIGARRSDGGIDASHVKVAK
jgi:hypothetical protein